MTGPTEIKNRGYTVQKNLFTETEFHPLLERLVNYARTITGQSDTTLENLWTRIENLAAESPEKRKLLFNVSQLAPEISALAWSKKIQDLLSSLGFKNPILKNTNLRIDIPGHADFFLVDWHQDLNNLDADLSYTVWIPLQPVNVQTGGVVVYETNPFQRIQQPSHTAPKGYQRVDVEKIVGKEKFVEMDFGDALIFDPFLPHRSQVGVKGVRLTLILRFDCFETFFEVTGKNRGFDKLVTEDPYLASKNAQELYSPTRR